MSMARGFSCLLCGDLPPQPIGDVTVRSDIGHHASVRCPSCANLIGRRVSGETALSLLARGAQLKLTSVEVESTAKALVSCDDLLAALDAEVRA